MSNSIKQQWLNDLRNPKTQQCFGSLSQIQANYENGSVINLRTAYCAMGVLGAVGGMCEIKEHMQQFWPDTGDLKASQILLANDVYGLSLPAIAEMIESWSDDVVLEPVISNVASKQKELTCV